MNSRCQFIEPNPSLLKVVIFSIVLSYDAATRSLLMVFLCTNDNLLKIETDDCSKKLDCFHNYHFFLLARNVCKFSRNFPPLTRGLLWLRCRWYLSKWGFFKEGAVQKTVEKARAVLLNHIFISLRQWFQTGVPPDSTLYRTTPRFLHLRVPPNTEITVCSEIKKTLHLWLALKMEKYDYISLKCDPKQSYCLTHIESVTKCHMGRRRSVITRQF